MGVCYFNSICTNLWGRFRAGQGANTKRFLRPQWETLKVPVCWKEMVMRQHGELMVLGCKMLISLLTCSLWNLGLPTLCRVFVTPAPRKKAHQLDPCEALTTKRVSRSSSLLRMNWDTEQQGCQRSSGPWCQTKGHKSSKGPEPRWQSSFHQRTSGVQGPCGWVSLGFFWPQGIHQPSAALA